MGNKILSRYEGLLSEHMQKDEINQLFTYLNKLERIAEVTTEYRNIVSDIHASNAEENFVYDKLETVCEEYEFFLDNSGLLEND
tara:strand:- start:1590 stop:1841 length:252 start_codon:yes stop_codon:yes gene_type:complete